MKAEKQLRIEAESVAGLRFEKVVMQSQEYQEQVQSLSMQLDLLKESHSEIMSTQQARLQAVTLDLETTKQTDWTQQEQLKLFTPREKVHALTAELEATKVTVVEQQGKVQALGVELEALKKADVAQQEQLKSSAPREQVDALTAELEAAKKTDAEQQAKVEALQEKLAKVREELVCIFCTMTIS